MAYGNLTGRCFSPLVKRTNNDHDTQQHHRPPLNKEIADIHHNNRRGRQNLVQVNIQSHDLRHYVSENKKECSKSKHGHENRIGESRTDFGGDFVLMFQILRD